MSEHVCTCGDCAIDTYMDACKYEAAIEALEPVLHMEFDNSGQTGRDLNEALAKARKLLEAR